MKIIIGLGNIGKEYERTYHNCGFLVVDKLLSIFNISKSKKECSAEVFETNVNGDKIIFAKPQTYMNNSGISFAALEKKYGANTSDMIVIHDDMDIEPGLVRIRNSGSAGTHNGMKSVLAFAASQDFIRFRVGIGRPQNGQMFIDYVVSKMPKDSPVQSGIDKCADAIKEYILGENFENIRAKYSK